MVILLAALEVGVLTAPGEVARSTSEPFWCEVFSPWPTLTSACVNPQLRCHRGPRAASLPWLYIFGRGPASIGVLPLHCPCHTGILTLTQSTAFSYRGLLVLHHCPLQYCMNSHQHLLNVLPITPRRSNRTAPRPAMTRSSRYSYDGQAPGGAEASPDLSSPTWAARPSFRIDSW